MKRALAERAKGDNLAPDLSIPDTPRLSKTPRVTHNTTDITSSDVITATADGVVGPNSSSSTTTIIGAGASLALPPSFSSPSPLQSMMPMFISSTALPTTTSTTGGGSLAGNDDGSTQDRSYYLQYQNRALVGELLRLKHVVQTLEQERLARRTQCDFARQCVDTIHGMWFALETSLSHTIAAKHPHSSYPPVDTQAVIDPSPGKVRSGETIPFVSCSSSGEGTNVETISGLLRALSQLASHSPPPAITVDAAATDPSSKSEVSAPPSTTSMSSSFNLQTTLTGVQTRVNNLLHMILSLLGAVLSSNNVFLNAENNAFAPQSSFLIDYSDYITKVSTLQGQLDAFHVQLEEISSSRDEALLKEKRIRRYLLRIMSGQSKEDVLRDVELEIDDVISDELISQTNENSGMATLSSIAPSRKKKSRNATEESASLEQIEKFQEQINDLEARCTARQEQIDELIKERFELQSRINTLVLKKEKTENHSSSREDNHSTTTQSQVLENDLATLQAREKSLMSELDDCKVQLARSKGELDAIHKGLDDQHLNFIRRWKEITGEAEDDTENGPHDAKTRTDVHSNDLSAGKEPDKAIIASLELKLQQALEGSRRAEVFRQNIAELNTLVESLQKQIEEWKEKCQSMEMQQSQSQVASSVPPLNKATTKIEGGEKKASEVVSPSTQGSKDSTAVNMLDKLQKENRKLRRDITMHQTAREGQKSKVEQLRSEKEVLIQSNQRLLKQSMEKEEINAEALSTILQLRQRLELHSQEKEEWEKKFKASQQLALAARLAATARERVDDELKKEKEEMETILLESKAENSRLAEKNREMELEVTLRNSEILSLKEELEAAQSRCDDLLSESNVILKAKASALEELHATKKKYFEVKKSVAKGFENVEEQASETQFTAKQLSTQLDVYKGRLACPVCNNRDKSCILLRCRHMFCRQCVDTSIKNRSRKCPACGIRFDTKDVGDIWL